MDQLEKSLNDMMTKSKIDDAMTIEPDQDLSVDKEAVEVKKAPAVEVKKEPVSKAMTLLLELFKKETRSNNFYDHKELAWRKKVQKFLIENKLLETHECARR